MHNQRKESRLIKEVIICERCRQGQIGKGVLVETTIIAQITAKVRKPVNYIVVKYRCDYCNAETTNRDMDKKNRVSMLTAKRAYHEHGMHPKDDGETA